MRQDSEKSRSRRFAERVEIERSILVEVNNSRLGKHQPLAGLTTAAISAWSSRIEKLTSVEHREAITTSLAKISVQLGLLVEDSCAVFDEDGRVQSGPERFAVFELRQLLAS
jgi:hypothetical protein